MRSIVIASIACGLICGVAAARPTVGRAVPSSVWVLNQTVVDASGAAAGCTVPHHCNLTTPADRAVLLSSFNALQTMGGAQVQQEPSGFMGTPTAGFSYILVQTDSSPTPVQLNGRGLTCTPACDAIGTSSPDADNFLAYKIMDTGTHGVGDMFPATAIQEAVTVDSTTIRVVAGPAPSVGGIAEQPSVAALPAAGTGGSRGPAAYAIVAAALALLLIVAVRWRPGARG